MKNKWKIIGLIFIILLCAFVLTGVLFFWGDALGYITIGQKITIWLQAMLLILIVLLTPIIITNSRRLWAKDKAQQESLHPTENKKFEKPKPFAEFTDIEKYCRYRYGRFWRYKVRKILVNGNKNDVNNLIPELVAQTWLVGDGNLLVWGGDVYDEINPIWIKTLKRCFGRFSFLRYKPIDTMVWVLPQDYSTNQRKQITLLETALLQIRARNKVLGWELPLYLVENKSLEWDQSGRIEQGIGVYFNQHKKQNIDEILSAFLRLSKSCTEIGMKQVTANYHHAFLLELANYLENKQIPLLKQWLARFFSTPKHPPLRGILFNPISINKTPTYGFEVDHHFQNSVLWEELLKDSRKVPNKRIGTEWSLITCITLLGLMAMVVGGLFVSYFNNRALISETQLVVNQIQHDNTYTKRLQTQVALQLKIDQLHYRHDQGVPLSYRFGLSHNNQLLNSLWGYYQQVNEQNMSQPLVNWLQMTLSRVTAMSPDDPKRSQSIDAGYDVLKSYLMLGYPDKADGDYLSRFVTESWPHPKNISQANWQKLMPDIVKFWGSNVAAHPSWAVTLDKALIQDMRQLLVNQIGLQNAENTIYQGIIQRAKQRFANQSLVKLLNGIDSRMLFSSDDVIPGVYTRQAWEDMIKNEIASASKSRQEQIDWVLSDGHETLVASVSPEVLKQRLTDRYFSDYSTAWLQFLNNIQWRNADTVSDVIEQLSLLSDARLSPLIALINVVKYHAEVAYSGGGLSDDLLRSAQDLIKTRNVPTLPQNNEASGPLTATFMPLLNLLKNDNSNGLSLQTYLLRVTQLRLKLQNIASSANPQAMAQTLAKSVFQGTSVDLTDTRDYGNLIAANLGEEWSGFGYSMFKQPLEQAWQVILTPAAKSFNDTWRNNIAFVWEKSFAGRYPFKDTDNDASLAELARFLRPDAGLIDKFIQSELAGVLIKLGDQWVPDPINAQGLHFNPQFLAALNLFNQLSTQVFLTGDANVEFDLMPRSGNNVVKSELIIDKQKIAYFNQMPTWHRLRWPGENYSPFAQLSWSSDETGLKLYEYYAGDWGFIRLLESAFIRQIDSSRYELIWKVPPQTELKYILRTQTGAGPINLLKLRNFTLPKVVFDTRDYQN